MEPTQLLKSNIIELLGLQDLPKEKQDDLVAKMSEVVQHRITDRLLERLPVTAQADLDALIAKGATSEEFDGFLQKVIPEYNQIMAEEITVFKQEMLDDVGILRQMVTKESVKPK
ncbi:MAG: DUF5663 domain-containing protein [Patescibacteria group bacterium]|jgi:hypothetical protein